MHVTDTRWGSTLQIEASKFWLYAIVVSIMLSIYDLLNPCIPTTSPPSSNGISAARTGSLDKDTSSNSAKADSTSDLTTLPSPTIKCPRTLDESPTRNPVERKNLYKQLTIDLCDLTIPGAAIGWIPIDSVSVGLAMAVSSLLAGQDLWSNVQSRNVRS